MYTKLDLDNLVNRLNEIEEVINICSLPRDTDIVESFDTELNDIFNVLRQYISYRHKVERFNKKNVIKINF